MFPSKSESSSLKASSTETSKKILLREHRKGEKGKQSKQEKRKSVIIDREIRNNDKEKGIK